MNTPESAGGAVGPPEGMTTGTVVVGPDVLGPLAPLTIRVTGGAYPLTPASHVALTAIRTVASDLRGVGVDWGCGTGCLALAAAAVPTVDRVWAFDVDPANVALAKENVGVNGRGDRVMVCRADSYTPTDPEDRMRVRALRGAVDFILANPPASRDGDGFAFRRRVVREAAPLVRPGTRFLIQISLQYGDARIRGLVDELPGLRYDGCVASSPWLPFDQSRSDLRGQLEAYARAEIEGGTPYTFGDPTAPDDGWIDAQTALAQYRETGASPLSRWQVHDYRWMPDEKGTS